MTVTFLLSHQVASGIPAGEDGCAVVVGQGDCDAGGGEVAMQAEMDTVVVIGYGCPVRDVR